jgi:hypothetical protein
MKFFRAPSIGAANICTASLWCTRGTCGTIAGIDEFTGALCADFETGPKRSGIGGERTVEQRAGRGQLNRLKMLKRQMYGRAGIELLRACLLPEPAFSDP